jgi:hypothetical protein
MRQLLHCTLALALFAIGTLAADVNGTWTAQMPGRGGDPQEATMTFQAKGEQLTGSITTQRGERPIENGKITGDDISFNQTMEFGGNKVTILYKGKVVGDEIRFTRQREGGQGQAREFVAKRKAS